MVEQSVVINRSLFDVFDYLMDVERFWEWVPYYVDTALIETDGDGWPARFRARVGVTWDLSYETEVAISDVRYGRSISYRSAEPPQVATYTLAPAPSGTILTASHSPWAMFGLAALQGPLNLFGMDYLDEALSNVKHTLEARPPLARPLVFLSYRRQSAEYIAGRIVETIAREFGEASVFRDLQTIAAGENPDHAIVTGLEECIAVIVLIDEKWVDAFEVKAEAAERDYVLEEIQQALEWNKPMIPVALQHVDMDFVQKHLPDDLQALGSKQWQQLRYDPDFTSDIDRVLKAIWLEVWQSGPRHAPRHRRETRRRAPGRRGQFPWADMFPAIMESWMDVWRRSSGGP
jgi:hypothetical protein